MIKHNQDGAVNPWAISLIVAVVFLISAISFAGWAFTERQHYKNDTDAIVAGAVKKAKQEQSALKDKQFAEEAKKPLKNYVGPADLASLDISYPKTWSGYVDVGSGLQNAVLSGYFSPGVVPSAANKNSVFALRVELVDQPYDAFLGSLSGRQKDGKIQVAAYSLPRLPKVLGSKITGEVTEAKSVTMVVLPLRGQTLKVWTDGTQYLADFESNILPNFSFSP